MKLLRAYKNMKASVCSHIFTFVDPLYKDIATSLGMWMRYNSDPRIIPRNELWILLILVPSLCTAQDKVFIDL